MWKDFVALVSTVFTLSKDLAQAKEDIKKINQNIFDLTLALQRLSDKIEHADELTRTKQESFLLKLQLEFNKMEQRLPAAKPEKPQRRLPPARKDKNKDED